MKKQLELQIYGDQRLGVQTRRKFIGSPNHENIYLLYKINPKNFIQVSEDEFRVKEMDEELDQMEKNDTLKLSVDQRTRVL